MNSTFKFSNCSHNSVLEIDFGDKVTLSNLKNEFYRIIDFYGLKNISYFCVEDTKNKLKEPIVLSTYTMQWQNFYRSNDLFLHDPVLYQTFFNILPTDWQSYDISNIRAKNVISIGREYRIGDFGLSIPVRGPMVERAVVSLTYDGTESSWNLLKSSNIKDFVLISQLIHNTVIRIMNIRDHIDAPIKISLTPREMHCLYWASQGKTAYETSIIMGISPNTVRAYIESARHSLNCVSVTQAVCEAIKLNLMPIYLKTHTHNQNTPHNS